MQVQGESSRVVSASGPEGVLSQAGARLKYRGLSGTVVTMAREEGLLSLYNGLIPGLQRQLCFASVRIGLYDTVKHMYMDFFNGQSLVILLSKHACRLRFVGLGNLLLAHSLIL